MGAPCGFNHRGSFELLTVDLGPPRNRWAPWAELGVPPALVKKLPPRICDPSFYVLESSGGSGVAGLPLQPVAGVGPSRLFLPVRGLVPDEGDDWATVGWPLGGVG